MLSFLFSKIAPYAPLKQAADMTDRPDRFYQYRLFQLHRSLAHLMRIDRVLVSAKIITTLLLPFFFLIRPLKSGLTMSLVSLVFLLEFIFHEPILKRISRLKSKLMLIQYEIDLLNGLSPPMPPPWLVSDPNHPYDTDLNISGPNGLFAFLSRCQTICGQKTLQNWLLEPAPLTIRLRRQKAIQELKNKIRFCHNYLSSTLLMKAKIRKNLDLASIINIIPPKPLVPKAILFLPLLNIPLLFIGLYFWKWWPVLLFFVLLAGLNQFTATKQKKVIHESRGVWQEMRKYKKLLLLIENESVDADMLVDGQARLKVTKYKASKSVAHLGYLLQWLELRGSMIHPLINNLFLWDLLFISRLILWREKHGPHLIDWISVCSEWESLCSLSMTLFNHPDWTFPEFVSSPLFVEIKNLGHPLLPRKAQKTNDCQLPGPHHLFFISGPNMAGKSTFLRTLATAIVMAHAGAPVHACQMRLGPLTIITSLHHTDSLSEGKSLFHKELDRLMKIWQTCQNQPLPVLFFLDEMLRGTNPLDRFHGSFWVLKLLTRTKASGVVATHDLRLTCLTDQENHGLSVQNAHFSCIINANDCFFDYQIKPGTAPSVNALPLMRQRGLPIPDIS